MTFAGYFQKDSYLMDAYTLNGVPRGEPTFIPRHKLTHIITEVPEGTTRQMVEEKMKRKSPDAIKLEFCIPSECPSDVQAEIEAPDNQVTQVSWKQLL